MKANRFFILITLLSLLLAGCQPGGTNDMNPPIVMTNSVVINNSTRGFTYIRAIYNPKFRSVHIEALTNAGQSIAMGFYLTASTLGVYDFLPNGSNTAIYANSIGETGYSDLNDNTLDGNIELTKLDSTSNKLSAKFAYKTLNPSLSHYDMISDGVFENIPLEIASVENTPNFMKCTANGSAEWFSDVVRCTVTPKNATDSTLRVEAFGLEGMRYLLFTIPLARGATTFNIKQQGTADQFSDCAVTYYLYKNDWNYFPVLNSGTLTITSIDPAAKKLKATFNLQVKNISGDPINFTSGQLDIAYW